MVSKTELMNKDEVVKFDLLAMYFKYLKSFEQAFKKELEEKIHTKIKSSITSINNFFDNNGLSQMRRSEYLELEQINFQLRDSDFIVKICIFCGKTNKAGINFTNTKGEGYFYDTEEESTDVIFSIRIIEAAVQWLQKGIIDPDIKERYVSFMEENRC